MPVFGDYETVGGPLASSDERDSLTTIWLARKSHGRERRPRFVVKHYIPHRSSGKFVAAEEAPLATDRGLEFLEGVKQLRKAHSGAKACLSPVHAFGQTDEGVWYVTDYHPRRDLKLWITRHGAVNAADLRHVVRSVVAGCLAMKRSRGYSHGNLKPANVFLAGKTRALGKTPLVLADPYPVSAAKLNALARKDQQVLEQLIAQGAELQDLRALGELIFQLVESRLITRDAAYNYPVQPSPAWDKLGKDGQCWLDLCNQLLDPHLTLEQISLESLAREFPLGPGLGKLSLAVAVLGGVCLVSAGVYFGIPWHNEKLAPPDQDGAAVTEGQPAFEKKDYDEAEAQANEALKYKPGDDAATRLQDAAQKGAKAEKQYQAALEAGQEALGKKNDGEAEAQANEALEFKPGDDAATRLQDAAQKGAKAEKQYQAALEAGQEALGKKNDGEAEAQANEALKYKPGDDAATRLQDAAQKGAKAEKQYQAALEAGQEALGKKNDGEAEAQANEALKYKPGDDAATRLQDAAQKGAKAEKQYQAALEAGQEALGKKNDGEAEAQANEALKYKPGDDAATRLQDAAQKGAKAEKQYQAALEAGQEALGKKNDGEAEAQANEALKYKPGDDAATRLQDAAQKGAKAEKQYQAALEAGQEALGKKNDGEAEAQANEALKYKPGDDAATRLQDAAQKGAKAEKQYQAALEAGQEALGKKNYREAEAETRANEALRYKPNDVAATELQDAAQKGAKAEKQYQAALEAGQEALGKKNDGEAEAQANEALKYKPGDDAATELRDAAQDRIRQAAAAAEQEEKLEQKLKTFLVCFKVEKVDDPPLIPKEYDKIFDQDAGKKVVRLQRWVVLSKANKDRWRSMAGQLRNEYAKAGLLNNELQATFAKIDEAIRKYQH